MNGRLRIALAPRWFLLDGSLTISLDGERLHEGGLGDGLAIDELEVEAGHHELSTHLIGLGRREQTFDVDVLADRTVLAELDYSRMTANLSVEVKTLDPYDLAHGD